jgi:CPA1 family monovalent cation:H+ antiporter
MAVVTAGIMFGRAQHRVFSARTRLEARAVWEFIEFVLTSLVFIIIGLQLDDILERLAGRGWWELAGITAVLALVLILSRFVWVYPAALLPRALPGLRRRDPSPGWKPLFVISWAGMRGVVSLAAAIALPLDFPERDLIVFLAFAAILVTLVLQGTTLGWIVTRLGLVQPPPAHGIEPEEAEARHAAARAMLGAIERRAGDLLYGPIAQDLLHEHRDRADHLARAAKGGGAAAAERAARRALRLEALDAARMAILALHGQGKLAEEALTKLSQELDFEENRLRRALG